MRSRILGPILRTLSICLVFWAAASSALAAPWFPLGPYGGDARSFAADPSDSKHLFLGTANGWLYESHDAGASWTRLSQVGKRDDLVLDHMLIDPSNPKRLLVGAYRVDKEDGGIYVTQDGGRNWYEQAQMRGQSVRAVARSASDPQEIVAGTLQGVYRSNDGGTHWSLISPADSKEIHEVQSVAIDPKDSNVIYAGTWHLPWKTTDGGKHWESIHEGIIDDSDVFSIIIDPETPNVVYASACSGIYKSTTAAEPNPKDPLERRFNKIQGIPSTARRTRKLLQDPTNLDTVYAGTTEGLYKTTDGGKTFARTTNANVIINDVYVDPANANHVLLATDHGGVLSSEDGGTTFESSNTGFSARLVYSFAANSQGNSTLYVSVLNDKETGGVFQSSDGGLKWVQQSDGLGGRDVFSLLSTQAGTLLAGTGHGIYRFQGDSWALSSDFTGVSPAANMPEAPGGAAPPEKERKPVAQSKLEASKVRATLTHTQAARAKATRAPRRQPANRNLARGKLALRRVAQSTTHRTNSRQSSRKPAKPIAAKPASPPAPPSRLDGIVYSMVDTPAGVYAGTDQGLLRSKDDGLSWARVTSQPIQEVHFVAANGGLVLAAGLRQLQVSEDGGETWTEAPPPDLTQIAAVGVDEKQNLWVGGGEGVFYSSDHGSTWKSLRNLFVHGVDGIYFDAPEHRVLVASSLSTFAFAVHLPDYKVSYWETGWQLRFVRPVSDHLIGATLFDGMVLQPQMVDSPMSPAK